ncbi:MAG: ABC transporter ATP-binding protein [Nocardioidaceae bacterium]
MTADGGSPVIRSTGLTKRYGQILAVDAIDLEVHEGDVYGFLGANGSGKTTTVRMLLGLVLPTSGTAQVLGRDIPKYSSSVLGRVGTLVEGPAAYGHLSGRANLTLFDAMAPAGGGAGNGRRGRRNRVGAALEQVGLAAAANRKVKGYSLGMRQRLGLAAAMLRAPRLLVLDEPTNGLDPQGIHEIRDLLLGLNAQGTTIFLSSHLLAEVEQMCTHVGVLDRGRLVVQDSLPALQAPTGRTVVITPDGDRALGLLDGRVEQRAGDRLVVRAQDPATLNRLLVESGVRVHELGAERRGLEEVVLEATTSSPSHATTAVRR